MIKKCLPLPCTALALLITLLFAYLSVAESEQAAKTPSSDAFIYPHFLFKGCVERVLKEKV